jgi:hypothetical protein
MIPNAYQAYVMWMAVKRHFTSSYDYIKYKGKLKSSEEAFEKKNYKKFFYSLSSKYKQDLLSFYVSVYTRDGNADVWCAELLEDSYHTAFMEREKRLQTMTRTFTKDVKTLKEYMEESGVEFKELLMSHNGNLPPIIQLEVEHICTESVVLIDRMTSFTHKYNVHPAWEDHILRLTKAQPFVTVDSIGKYATILKEGV